jgi:hypothetical protein
LPYLDTYPHRPGDWFSDGGEALADQWQGLRSLTLPYYYPVALLRQLSEKSWWKQLRALDLMLHSETETLSILGDRLPEGLREFRLAAGSSPADLIGLEPFLERLGQVSLRRLHLRWLPLPAATLARLLDGTNRWELKELSLDGCELTDQHYRILAESQGARSLVSLSLTGDWNFDRAAGTLFSSRHLRSLVHLNLSNTCLGTEGALALASAPSWDRLRSLDLSDTGLGTAGLRALLSSANLRRLNWFNVSGAGADRTYPELDVSPDMAIAMVRLPYLASLRLDAHHLDEQCKRVLQESDSLAWALLSGGQEEDVQTWRASRSPERAPPLDAAFEGPLAGTWQE